MQKKKGISLIVLVITIIVMIILAAAIVITLNNSNIINKANEAVGSTDEAQLKQMSQVAWSEAYMDKLENENVELISATIEKIKNQGYDVTEGTETVFVDAFGNKDAIIEIGETRVKITEKGTKVLPNVEKVLNAAGLQIGNKVLYTPGAHTSTTDSTFSVDANDATEWYVMGVDEDGNIKLVGNTETTRKLTISEQANSTTRMLEATAKMDKICDEVYGQGLNAAGARNITLRDFEELAGVRPQNGETREYRYYTLENEMESHIQSRKIGAENWNSHTGVQELTFLNLGKLNSESTRTFQLTATSWTNASLITSSLEKKTINEDMTWLEFFWVASPDYPDVKYWVATPILSGVEEWGLPYYRIQGGGSSYFAPYDVEGFTNMGAPIFGAESGPVEDRSLSLKPIVLLEKDIKAEPAKDANGNAIENTYVVK